MGVKSSKGTKAGRAPKAGSWAAEGPRLTLKHDLKDLSAAFPKELTKPFRSDSALLTFLAGHRKGLTGLALVMVSACAPLLNPDPKTGGACHNGDQLGTLCADQSCAPAGYRCAYDGHGVEIDESQWGPGDVGTTYGAKHPDGGK